MRQASRESAEKYSVMLELMSSLLKRALELITIDFLRIIYYTALRTTGTKSPKNQPNDNLLF
ncbi:hypothetical protein KOY48_01795 [Candidatus Minimicrobia naudis]|uniref:Uncharacterized protein n=1 Tax=Candidatus Minimicrobia naudis TaxID=2841263 RepID=A0A8F1MDG6_9BACT|nr:hypothetical protein KOY48_01795 [Candidatus Minimicrobia naudis]